MRLVNLGSQEGLGVLEKASRVGKEMVGHISESLQSRPRLEFVLGSVNMTFSVDL